MTELVVDAAVEEKRRKLYDYVDELLKILQTKHAGIVRLARKPIMDGIYNLDDEYVVRLADKIREIANQAGE